MLYSPTARLAFVHIHKTGGISLREFLQKKIPGMVEMPELPGAHHSVAELHDALAARGTDPGSVRIITILRNPFAHALSIFTFWNSNAITAAERELPTVAFARSHTFSEFLRTVLIHDQYQPALCIDGVLPETVYVCRLESLKSDATRVVRDELGLAKRVRIARRNASEHGPYLSYYDENSLAHVRRVYDWCFREGFYHDETVHR